MPRIRILDAALADQIAAGEVIERPASVVKELLENALDAGARAITVEVREGGSELIRITDDGSGMEREDAALCVLRHATSKIQRHEDLQTIATLGFRGEALASIASVSRFRLLTRTAGALEGTELTREAGGPVTLSPIGAAPGTTVEIRDLFFNVPARRKFLKSKATESAQVGEACLRVALLDHGLRLTLLRDGRRAAEYLPVSDWSDRATHIVTGKRIRVEDEYAQIKLRAVLGAPEDSRSGALALHVFVNGRPVRERSLARSVAFAYGSVMPPGRYPVGLVHLTLDPSEVDVNVHPQKAEVRFQRGREVHEAVTRMLAKALGTSAWKGPAARGAAYWGERLPEGPTREAEAIHSEHALEARGTLAEPFDASASVETRDPWGLSTHSSATEPPTPLRTEPIPYPAPHATLPLAMHEALAHTGWSGGGPGPASPSAVTQPPSPLVSRYRALAQSKNLFIVAENERGLCVIDQHAADERVHYHHLRTQYAARAVRTQRLLLPERVELSEREALLVEAHADEIARSGLEVALIGARSAVVQAVPALLRRAPPERLLRDLLGELARTGERGFGDALDMALATMACHGSIRAGDALSLSECQALLDKLASIDEFAGHCPHGRPIVFEIRFDELARKVGR